MDQPGIGGRLNNRIRAVRRVNARTGCRGFLTRKRALENYLYPGPVVTPDEGEFAFGDHHSVPLLLAQRWYRSYSPVGTWAALQSRSQRRQLNQAKRWLNTVAVKRMTAALLAASAMVAYARLVERGKEDLAYPTVLARYAVAQIYAGRCVVFNTRDYLLVIALRPATSWRR